MNEKQNTLGYALGLEARGFVAEAAELRRLHTVNQELLEALDLCSEFGGGYSNCAQAYLPPAVLDKAYEAIAKAGGWV